MTITELLDRYQSAVLHRSADQLAELYTDNAVHEAPFTFPGIPSQLRGSEEIRATFRAAWSQSDAIPDAIETLATYGDGGGRTLVVEQVVSGVLGSTGRPFSFPGILVLTSDGERLTKVRDYMDGLAVAIALGRLSALAARLDPDRSN